MLNFENLEFESMNMLLVDQLKGGMEAAFLPHFQEFGKHLHQEEEELGRRRTKEGGEGRRRSVYVCRNWE